MINCSWFVLIVLVKWPRENGVSLPHEIKWRRVIARRELLMEYSSMMRYGRGTVLQSIVLPYSITVFFVAGDATDCVQEDRSLSHCSGQFEFAWFDTEEMRSPKWTSEVGMEGDIHWLIPLSLPRPPHPLPDTLLRVSLTGVSIIAYPFCIYSSICDDSYYGYHFPSYSLVLWIITVWIVLCSMP